jgi:uncharacterized membrane protein YeaQ/YmgE (transglycosylase-associated protein family)
VWLLKKATAVLSGVKIEIRSGPVDSAPDLVSSLLALPEVSAYIRELQFPQAVEREETTPSEPPPDVTLPTSREIWKALIAAEEETLPEVEVAGAVERDSSADCLRVPYSMASGPLDFDPDDVIEVFQEIEGELRKVGELNTRDTSLTTLVIEHPFKFPHKLGVVEGTILDIVLGIVGAVVGGFLFQAFGASGVTGLNLYSILVAVVGSVVFLVAYHALPSIG